MKLNKKQKLLIFFSALCIGIICFLRNSNKPRDTNVILITLDALRPDHLGCYGYNRNTSPNIDRLAKEGVLFTQTISQASWTNSLVSLLTSTYPSTHKVMNWGNILDKKLLTLAGILKKEQYVTACTSGGDWIYKDFPGIGRGFDYFFDQAEIDKLTDQVVDWIVKFQKKRFFIWIHFFDYPHAPYLPPSPYNKVFVSHETQRFLPIGKGMGYNHIPDFVAVNNVTNVDYYISQYDGEIAYADGQIGKILVELKKLNLYDNTLLIISADHGESLGEHNYYFQHGYYLYDQLLKVPLIIKGTVVPRGKIINHQVQSIDIVPTILSLFKIKVNTKMEGKSLTPIIFNKTDGISYAFSEMEDRRSIRTTEWKLIHNTLIDKYELYNLKIDPGETNNLVEIEKEQFEFLKAELEKWMNRSKPDINFLTKPLDEGTKKRLNSLGYLQ